MTELERISREGGENFQLGLEQTVPLYAQQVVRRIPGRRVVCHGTWQGKAVYAKLFIGDQAARYVARDAQGARALMEKGLPTPELLHEGAIADGLGKALIFAAVPDSCNAETVWKQGGSPQRHDLATRLVLAVAAHHAAGLVQTDLYPRNFLLSGDVVYTLDGDGIRIYEQGVPREVALDNLALLLSKFDALDDVHIPEWLAMYARVRGWQESISPEALQSRVRKIRYRSARKNVLRKALRNCSDILVSCRFDRFLAVVRSELDADLNRLMENPDRVLDTLDDARLKSGNTCTVGLVQSGARRVVVKRYNIKNFWHGLGRLWRRSRASVSWANAHLLQAFEIPTPPPLALIERRWGPLRREAWFLAAFVNGPDITEIFASSSLSEAQKQDAAEQVARLLHKLRLLGIEHGDMKATNMKWVDGAPLLLDLDAMKMHRCEWRFARRHTRDLRRFLKNWHNAPDILRMVKSALMQVYGNDPLLKLAGIEKTSETT
jgi:tRNA A-37 threonylcarbamoyl transferase component Bud32